jgi:hypothetical protein
MILILGGTLFSVAFFACFQLVPGLVLVFAYDIHSFEFFSGSCESLQRFCHPH